VGQALSEEIAVSNFWEKQASETPATFWEEMREAFIVESAIDSVLSEKDLEGPVTTSMRGLTDKARAAKALILPQPSGTRVSFVANLGSVLSYDDCPGEKMAGTVIMVKTAEGNLTHREGRAFVLWDDGKFRPILAEHLRLAPRNNRVASVIRMTASSLGDLSGLFASSSGKEDELVHRATQDLWSFRQEGEQYVIERLFDDTGNPLKV
jgi:hypothetical protein